MPSPRAVWTCRSALPTGARPIVPCARGARPLAVLLPDGLQHRPLAGIGAQVPFEEGEQALGVEPDVLLEIAGAHQLQRWPDARPEAKAVDAPGPGRDQVGAGAQREVDRAQRDARLRSAELHGHPRAADIAVEEEGHQATLLEPPDRLLDP